MRENENRFQNKEFKNVFWKQNDFMVLAGTVAGAAGISYLNRNRMDFSHMKPFCTGLLAKGINLKDSLATKVSEMKEDFEDMAAEARDRVDSAKAGDENAGGK